MSIYLTGTSGFVGLGSPSDLDNITESTWVVVFKRPASTANQQIFNKGIPFRWNLRDSSEFRIRYSTTHIETVTVSANYTYTTGNWYMAVVTINSALYPTAYNADLTNGELLHEPPSYTARTTGSGTREDDSASVLNCLNSSAPSSANDYEGDVAFIMITESYMRHDELLDLQNDLMNGTFDPNNIAKPLAILPFDSNVTGAGQTIDAGYSQNNGAHTSIGYRPNCPFLDLSEPSIYRHYWAGAASVATGSWLNRNYFWDSL